MTEITDVLIIGAGPSGSAAAAILQQEGFKVTILEKTTFPRFVIGESLLPRCMDLLEEANLLEVVKSVGFQEKFGAEFIQGDERCDFEFSEQFTDGWKWTWQVPRADFDKVLIDEVERRGVDVRYQHTVNDVEFNDDGVLVKASSPDGPLTFSAKYIVDASGYGRVLPRLMELDEPSDFPSRSALFSHVEGDNRTGEFANRIQVTVIEDDLWVWVIPFSNGITSVGVVGDLSALQGTDREQMDTMLKSHPILEERFKNANYVFEPKRITGYSSGVKRLYGDRFVLTGNSTEFLDPIFSSGVTFAFESGILGAKLIARELKGETVNWEEEFVAYIRKGVDVFRSYVTGWYDGTLRRIFFASTLNETIKRQICSVLAGYVWDDTNPYVKKHDKGIQTLAKFIAYNFPGKNEE